MHNALLAFEVFHYMKNRRSERHGDCALKLDMMKADVRVEWSFLEHVMLKMGFMPLHRVKWYLLGDFGREILSHPIFSSYVLRPSLG